MIQASIKTVDEDFAPPLIFPLLPLNYLLSIYYLKSLKKNYTKIQALIDFDSKVHAMNLDYTAKLGLKIWFNILKVQNIDGFILDMFKIILTSFHIKNKLKKAQLFQKIHWMAKTSMTLILTIFFLTFSNLDMLFIE